MKVQTLVAAVCVFGGLLVVGGGLAVWKYIDLHKKDGQSGAFEPPESVQLVQARTIQWGPTARLVGTVFPVRSITVASEIAGVVREVNFESDIVVEQGQVLLMLDTSTEQADLAAAEASIRVSEASVRAADAAIELWDSNVKRLTTAVEQKAMAQTDLDNARSQLDAAKAQRDKARAEIDQAQSRANQVKATIAKKTIRAPFKSRTGLRHIHPGQYLAEGTIIVGLQGVTDQIYLDFAIPQEYSKRVHRGYSVMATSAVLGAEPVRIEVESVDAVADRNTRNIRVRSLVPNADQRLRPGMAVDVTVPVEEPAPVIVIPTTAVRRASYGDHVFLVLPSDKKGEEGKFRAKQQFIKLGAAVGPDVIVTDGLKAGDEVAAAGSFKLRDGALVMKGPPPGAKPAAAPATTSAADTKK